MRYPHFESIQSEANRLEIEWGLKPQTLVAVLDPTTSKYSLNNWSSKVKEGKILLNAMSLHPKDVPDIIRQEMTHMVYEDREVQTALGRLFQSLPKPARTAIEEEVRSYKDDASKKEAAQTRAFEILTKESNKSLWEKVIASIESAWNRLTNKKAIPLKEEHQLISVVFNKGIEKLKELEKETLPITGLVQFSDLMDNAASNGDIETIKQCQEKIKGHDVEHLIQKSAAVHAVEKGHTPIVEFLLSHGADIHAEDDVMLRTAAKNGHTATMKTLLENGADIHAKNDETLYLSAQKGNQPAVELAIQHKADVRASGHRAIRSALMMDEENTVEKMLSLYKTSDLKDLVEQDWVPFDMLRDLHKKIEARQKEKPQIEMQP